MFACLNLFLTCALLIVICIIRNSESHPICDSRGSPAHGGMHIRLRRPTGIAVIYSCESGYKLQGPTLAVCIQGKWTHPLPTCEKIFVDALNDARNIRTDAGVIVSTDELEPNPGSAVKIQQHENNEIRHRKGRKLRRRRKKKRRKNKNRASHLEKRKYYKEGRYRRPWLEAEQSHPPDVSCLSENNTSSGFIKAPRINNALNPRYVRRKVKDKRFVAAMYSCKQGFVLQNRHHYSLYCSDSKWVGTRPVCLHEIVAVKCDKAGCEHGCKEIDGRAQCFCFRGFTQTGTFCNDVNECQHDNGGCEHLCFNTPGSYYCQCKDGFRLSDDLKSCTDLNECLLRNGHGPCQGSCTNTLGSYYCSCESVPGTTLAEDSRSCRDIDECNDHMHCSHSCINTIGTAFCLCPTGYVLGADWRTCLDINECTEEEVRVQCPGGCVNTEGSYYCADDCAEGFSYTDGQCKDTDECSLPTRGGCTHKCINTPGSYECVCPNGYYLSEDKKTCLDTDECLKYPIGDICSHICINNIGSFSCDCPIGYELSLDNKTCEKTVDECETRNCSQKCRIENKIAQCSCENGYRLYSDNISCVDIDECSYPDSNVSCSHECLNQVGSYRCVCPEGYILNDPYNCVDYDECKSDKPCSDICVNTEGSFRCDCQEGYNLTDDGRTCEDINECDNVIDEGTAPCSHICVNTLGSFYCECRKGYILSTDSISCDDIDECTDDNEVHTLCSHECANSIGTYHCLCPLGYVLEKDRTTCLETNECQLDNGGCSHSCRLTDDKVAACDCPDNYYLSSDNKTCLVYLPSSVNDSLVKLPHTEEKKDKQNVFRNDITASSLRLGLFCNATTGEIDISECMCCNSGCENNTMIFGIMPCAVNNDSNDYQNNHNSIKKGESVQFVRYLNELVKQNSKCLAMLIDKIRTTTGEYVDTINEMLPRNKTLGCRVQEVLFKTGENKTFFTICADLYIVTRQVNITNTIRDVCDSLNSSYDDSFPNRLFNSSRLGMYLVHGSAEDNCSGPDCSDEYYCSCLNISECISNIGCNETSINTHGLYICSSPEGLTTNRSLSVETGNYVKGCSKLIDIENGEIECSDNDDNGIYPIATVCFLKCKTGYKLKGKKSTVCEKTGVWSENYISCIAIPRPFIRCPSNSRHTLPKGKKEMMVHLLQPKTNADWTRQVTSFPSWGKQLYTVLTVGVTTVTFKARSSVSDYVASCRTLVTVIDAEKPVIEDCPEDIYLKLAPGISVQNIDWKEPTFSDNVNVAHVYKTKSPGQLLGAGNHRVTYVAADSSGNIATCQFAIDITE